MHKSHPENLKRLHRARGHLQKVIQMIEEEKSCFEVAQQLQAVISALAGAKRSLILDHVEHCLLIPPGEKNSLERLEELKKISKYL